MATLITDIYDSIKAGGTEIELNTVINQHIDDFGLDHSARIWRVENYQQLRTWAYPSTETYTTAVSKIDSGDFYFDADLRAEGQTELDQYYTDYIAAAERFPGINPYAGNTNHTTLLFMVLPVQTDGGAALYFIQGEGADNVTVDGKYIDKRTYDISTSFPGIFLYDAGYYCIKFTGDNTQEKRFVAVKRGPKALFALAGLKARPMDCHRKLIARATI